MATVRMKKGNIYADIFDSPETIKQAQKDGYSLVEKTFEKTVTTESETDVKSESESEDKENQSARRGRHARQ